MATNANVTFNTVALAADPTAALGAATKQYVDTIAAAGIHYHDPVRVATDGNLVSAYNNGSSGVGATLTNSTTQAAITVDGIALSLNDRVLVHEQSTASQNGVYKVTTVGTGSSNWVLTRTTDTDSYSASDPDEFGQGDAFFILEGDTYAGHLEVMNTTGTITFGSTNITFTNVAQTAVYTARNGIELNGTVFSVDSSSSVIAGKLPLAGGTMTGNIAHASNFTLDVGGELTLDADAAGTIRLKDGGTEYATIYKSSNDFKIYSAISDGDILLQGNDGGSTVTALTLDMSAAGAATFNSSITTTGTLDAGNTTITSTDAGSAAGPDLVLYRNSSSPADGDYLGQIQFKGKQDGGADEIYAKVSGKVSDVTAGTEDALIETSVKGAGSFVIVSRQKSDELQLLNGNSLAFADSDNSHFVSLKSPHSPFSSNLDFYLPPADGTAGQALVTDGAGHLGFAAAGATISSDTSSNSNFLMYFASTTSGALTAVNQDAGLTYNPSTGTITADTFVGNVTGNLTGNVTGNVSGTAGSATGNAATATALQNTRAIGGVNFNGTAAIDLPGVNTAGNQDTSGNAATATILATARNIGGVSFNGSAAIDLPGVNTAGNQSTSGTAALATAVTATANNSTDETVYPTFVDGATGTQGIETDTGLTYNPSTGRLTSASFGGALTGDVTGNASTATTLANARAINGVDFDGSAAITVTAAAGTLSGSTLKATVTGSSLTSVGTISSGTWQGTSISTSYTAAKVTAVNGVTGAVTAANLLTAIKTVDGAGSGLDADLLDGQSGAYYRINVYNASGTLLN